MENNNGIMVNGSQRIGYIDALRGFTMFLVVSSVTCGATRIS